MSGYTMVEEDLWGLIAALGVKTKVTEDEVKFDYCPYCGSMVEDGEHE